MEVNGEREWIPNLNMGKDYDRRYLDAPIHYESIENLAGFFSLDMPVHRHAQHLQIHYVEQGDVGFHIDDELFQVAGPVCLYTPPSVPHSFLLPVGATGHVLTVHQSMLWRLVRGERQMERVLNGRRGICLDPSTYSERQLDQWYSLGGLFRDFGTEWSFENQAKPKALEALSRLLLIAIVRLSSRRTVGERTNNDGLNLFRQFSDLMEENFSDHWRLNQYADHLAVSESKLNSVCRAIANRSPKKLISDRLVQEAKRLLLYSDLTVKEICYRLGFVDPGYFSRFFKNQTGMTAHHYRSANRGEMRKVATDWS